MALAHRPSRPARVSQTQAVSFRLVDAADARLKQFEVLWAEIARRSNAQQALIGAAATATGTVAGLVVAYKADPVLFAALAVVTPVFGLLWLDHALNIGEIARFISANWQWGEPNWEMFYEKRKHDGGGRRRYVMFVLSITLVFLAPALAGLTASFDHLGDKAGRIAGWSAATGMTVLFFVAWSAQVVRGWQRQSDTPPLPVGATEGSST
jgi:hypothetical protein